MFIILLTTALLGLTLAILFYIGEKKKIYIFMALICALLSLPCLMDVPHILLQNTHITTEVKDSRIFNSLYIIHTADGSFFSSFFTAPPGQNCKITYAPHTRLVIGIKWI